MTGPTLTYFSSATPNGLAAFPHQCFATARHADRVLHPSPAKGYALGRRFSRAHAEGGSATFCGYTVLIGKKSGCRSWLSVDGAYFRLR